jgi:hypothetical protein
MKPSGWARSCLYPARTDEQRIQHFDQKIQGRKPLAGSRLKRDGNIKIDLRERGHEVVNGVNLAQFAVTIIIVDSSYRLAVRNHLYSWDEFIYSLL